MFPGNGSRPQHSHSPNASEANVNRDIQYAWPARRMGPPPLSYPPQPVEIDPVSYPRAPSSYVPWEGTTYPISSIGEPISSLSSSIGPNKTSPMSLDFGARNGPQDPLTSWYTGNDGPWIPKGAVPEVPPDERIHTRGYAPYRIPGCGLPRGIRHRPGNPSDNGSVPFGISPSDSGYGTLESASIRGSDVMDHSQDNRSLLGRVSETHQYSNEGMSRREAHGMGQWTYNTPGAPLRCPTCRKQVKTKSELKKHDLRHTKPFHCANASCSRIEGFSTVNDLDRHKKSKHPGDLSGEIRSKTYHCLVAGCKSPDKIWPRLDNFRSHLKRMHRLLEDAMDHFVHRGETIQRTKGSLPSQGTSSQSSRRLDQDVPLGLPSDDFPELSYLEDHPQWSHVSPSSLDRQTEITDPSLEDTDTQTLVPLDGDSPIDLEDEPGNPLSLGGSRASWEPNTGNGCSEKMEQKFTSPDANGESIAVSTIHSLGSPMGTLQTTTILEGGKTPKLKKALPVDPCLRDAIKAVISTANPGKENGSDLEHKIPPRVGSPDVVHVSEFLPCRIRSGTALPSPAATLRGRPDDQDPCLNAPSAFRSDKKDLTDQILQAIKDAGYVLKKDNKSSTGLGKALNSGSGINRKRGIEACSLCKFRGRPCELKKHMKRHTRPYGCTFMKCLKTFGSKNDWKRHESSQHYQHETWRCDEQTNDASCTKISFSADTARAHLTKMHKVIDPEATEQKIKAQHMGALNQGHFWCGFCEKIIDLTQRGVDAWTERFNHIDDHFMGRNCPKQWIAQWKPAGDDGEGVQQNDPAKPRSPNEGDRESSDGSSPLSSGTSSASPNISVMPPSPDNTPAQGKRKRANSDERGGRSKQSRHSKSELRTECCQCGLDLNPRIDIACPSDGHKICVGCRRKQVVVHEDNAE